MERRQSEIIVRTSMKMLEFAFRWSTISVYRLLEQKYSFENLFSKRLGAIL